MCTICSIRISEKMIRNVGKLTFVDSFDQGIKSFFNTTTHRQNSIEYLKVYNIVPIQVDNNAR